MASPEETIPQDARFRAEHLSASAPPNRAPSVVRVTSGRWTCLKRREGAGGEEVLADGGVEVPEGVEVLLLPVRKVLVERLHLLLFGVGRGAGKA
jgi:hypothetical protein